MCTYACQVWQEHQTIGRDMVCADDVTQGHATATAPATPGPTRRTLHNRSVLGVARAICREHMEAVEARLGPTRVFSAHAEAEAFAKQFHETVIFAVDNSWVGKKTPHASLRSRSLAASSLDDEDLSVDLWLAKKFSSCVDHAALLAWGQCLPQEQRNGYEMVCGKDHCFFFVDVDGKFPGPEMAIRVTRRGAGASHDGDHGGCDNRDRDSGLVRDRTDGAAMASESALSPESEDLGPGAGSAVVSMHQLSDEALAEYVVEKIRHLFVEVLGAGAMFDDGDVRVLTSSSKAMKKRSLHIIVRAPHLVFTFGDVCSLAKVLFEQLWTKHADFGVDTKVYSPGGCGRQFRLPGHSKLSIDESTGKLKPPRPLVPVAYRGHAPAKDVREYLLTYMGDAGNMGDTGDGVKSFKVPGWIRGASLNALAATVQGRGGASGASRAGAGAGGSSSTSGDPGALAVRTNLLHPDHIAHAERLMTSLHPDAGATIGVSAYTTPTEAVKGCVMVKFRKPSSACPIKGAVHASDTGGSIFVYGTAEACCRPLRSELAFAYHCFGCSRQAATRPGGDPERHNPRVEWDEAAGKAVLLSRKRAVPESPGAPKLSFPLPKHLRR